MDNQHTTAIHAGREDLTALGVHVPPLDASTTYPVPSLAAGGAAFAHQSAGGCREDGESLVYQRMWSPNVDRFERAVSALEGAPASVAYASGMAAIAAMFTAVVHTGKRHIVAVRPLYSGTDSLLLSGMLGTTVSWASQDDVADHITPETGLVYIETPANPTLDLVDIASVVRQSGDVPVAVDNTFCTPILQNPYLLGASMVMHSASKYMGGHGDQLGGVVAATHEWAEKLRHVRVMTGGLMTPQAAYVFHRGLQTMPLRVQAQQERAREVVAWLQQQDAVSRVYYPEVDGCDPRGLLGKQMSGPGSMVSFALAGGYDQAARVVQSTSMIMHGVSLGGVDTLIEHPAGLTHCGSAGGNRPHEDTLRLSVGLEDAADIIDDLTKALA